ncbi:MAG TPA: hypothetical protein VII56_14590 [Rhizomicrobium sp.]
MLIPVPVVHPVFRGGEVLDAHRNLDKRTSVETANLLAGRAGQLVDALSAVLEKNGASNLEYRRHDAEVKRLDSPIVDYPQFSFRFKNRTWYGRFSLTVCVKEKQSKIWVRLGPDINTVDDISTFESMSEIWIDCLRFRDLFIPLLRRFYDEGLRAKFGHNQMDVKHVLQVAVVDFCHPAAARLISRTLLRRPLAEITRDDEECGQVWSSFVRMFFANAPFECDAVTIGDILNCRFDVIPKCQPVATSLGPDERGIFVPYYGDQINYFGFSSATGPSQAGSDRWERVAFHVSGLFVNEVAEVF